MHDGLKRDKWTDCVLDRSCVDVYISVFIIFNAEGASGAVFCVSFAKYVYIRVHGLQVV